MHKTDFSHIENTSLQFDKNPTLKSSVSHHTLVLQVKKVVNQVFRHKI